MTVKELMDCLGVCEPGAEILVASLSPLDAALTGPTAKLGHVSYYVVERRVILYANWEGKSDGAPAEDQPGKD